MKLSDLITVAPRYTRSVNIERDLGNPGALSGYVITSTAYSILGRLLPALRDTQGNRAWTLTGPYGSGKSAFALFVANLLAGADRGSPVARRLLREQHPDLHREFFERASGRKPVSAGFATVSITGTQNSLVDALLDACVRDLAILLRGCRNVAVCRSLAELRSRSRAGVVVTAVEVVQTILGVSRYLRDVNKATGLIIVVDELGKFLEFAAANPDRSDIHTDPTSVRSGSLRLALAQRLTSVEALQIVISMAPIESMHFQTWHEKAGNAPPLIDPTNNLTFPNLNNGLDPNTGASGTGVREMFQTNLIMPEPCPFISTSLPACSVVRPTKTAGAAMGALNFLTAMGLFIGQSNAFFSYMTGLAQAADAAQRGV